MTSKDYTPFNTSNNISAHKRNDPSVVPFCLYTSPLLLMNLVVCFISRCGSLESNGSFFFKTCDQPVTLLRIRKKRKRNSVCRGHGIRVYAKGVLKFFKKKLPLKRYPKRKHAESPVRDHVFCLPKMIQADRLELPSYCITLDCPTHEEWTNSGSCSPR